MELENGPPAGLDSDLESQSSDNRRRSLSIGAKSFVTLRDSISSASVGVGHESVMDLQKKRIANLEGLVAESANAQHDIRSDSNGLVSQVGEAIRSSDQSQNQQDLVAPNRQQLSEIVDQSKKMIRKRTDTRREGKIHQSVLRNISRKRKAKKWRGGNLPMREIGKFGRNSRGESAV